MLRQGYRHKQKKQNPLTEEKAKANELFFTIEAYD